MQPLNAEEIEQRAQEIFARSRQPRRRARLRVAAPFRQSSKEMILTQAGEIAVWRAGDGPAVMLVHGWEDDHTLWSPLVEKLLGAGFSVIAFDLPGHGHSSGGGIGVVPAKLALHGVARHCGPIFAIAGHSLGASATLSALSEGVRADKAVIIAPPTPSAPQNRSTRRKAELAERAPELDDPVAKRVAELTRATGAGNPFYNDPIQQAAHLTQSALFIHCADDHIYAPSASHAIAAAWRGKTDVYVTSGFGHRQVARDSGVINRIVDFLKEEE
ncbi:MAG: alpha/beta hydrolase [Caulobacterales bacterium]